MSELKQVMSRRASTYDYLSMTYNNSVEKLLLKHSIVLSGDRVETEKVVFSDFIVKINPRDKPQERVLLVTNKAVYNLIPSDYSKCKRRIPLEIIRAITVSQVSDEFVLHVPSEYDYRIMSLRKAEVIECIQRYYHDTCGKTLQIEYTQNIVLKSICVTKKNAKKIKKDLLKSLQSTASADSVIETKENSSSDRITMCSEVSGWGKSYTDVTPDDFQLLKVLGRGSFGKVMLVNRKGEAADRVYAMKILRKEAIIRRNQVEHTKAEREILETIDHPFLMKMHYAFQTETKLYLVMDYLTGGELFFHLKNSRRFSEPRARLYAAEISLGIGHLHSQNIIYRDLKPENILLDMDGHIRLTDFGLSKRYSDGAKAQTFCGTPEYLAPEVISGVGHGKDVDWWSLGILLHEMLVGLPPFYSENVNIMYDYIQRAELRIPSFVSNEAQTLISGLLQRDPTIRLGSGQADIESIMNSPFFHVLEWDKVFSKSYEPEFIPYIASHTDTSNFDTEFTSEPVVDSVVPPSGITKQEVDFKGFTYQASSAMHCGDSEMVNFGIRK